MEPLTFMVENAFHPSQFTAAMSEGHSATVVTGGSSAMRWGVFILAMLVACGLLYAFYAHQQNLIMQDTDRRQLT
jgi:hypothetical protein